MLKLSCVNCGAPLEIGVDLETFACGYCGTQQRVERKGGVVCLRRVEAVLEQVQRGTDRTAAELAVARLTKEIGDIEAERNRSLERIYQKKKEEEEARVKMSGGFGVAAYFLAFLVLWATPLKWWMVFILSLIAAVAVTGWFQRERPSRRDDDIKHTNEEFARSLRPLKDQLEKQRAILEEALRA